MESSPPPAKKAKISSEITFNDKRVTLLSSSGLSESNDSKVKSVAYYMHRDQRVQDNWAMIYAQKIALEQKVPLHVVTMISICHPGDAGATLRNMKFCFEGLKEVSGSLRELNIAFHLLIQQNADKKVETFSDWMTKTEVGCLVTDFSPLREQRAMLDQLVSAQPKCPVYEVDAHNIVPVRIASDKQEYGARTIRKKITSKLSEFLTEFPPVTVHPHGDVKTAVHNFADKTGIFDPAQEDWDSLLNSLKLDGTVKGVENITGGCKAGMECLQSFVDSRIKKYGDKRNDPNVDALSNLSPWFHLGQIAVQRAVLVVKKKAAQHSSTFIEEAVVRRELTDNFCFYNDKYDSVDGASDWAQKTLKDHRDDKREYLYSLKEFETSATHDELWNAAQNQLRLYGKMHGFMRMYWAKKILEWTESPEVAVSNAIYLNDHYSYDGNDPNGYVGCMWSMCGVHDQGWAERPVFGKIRYMNYNGCKRKFDVDEYVVKYGGKNINEKDSIEKHFKKLPKS